MPERSGNGRLVASCTMALASVTPLRRSLLSLVLALALVLAAPVAAALAVSAADLPLRPPAEHVLDGARVLSRAGTAEIEHQLEAFSAERVDARLITLTRLDYGLGLDSLASQLLERWSADPPPAAARIPCCCC